MDPNDLLTMPGSGSTATSPGTRAATCRSAGPDHGEDFVMPIDEDMFFPPRDCVAEQE